MIEKRDDAVYTNRALNLNLMKGPSSHPSSLNTVRIDLKFVIPVFPQITYIETSAKDPPMNVDKAFHELVRVIR